MNYLKILSLHNIELEIEKIKILKQVVNLNEKRTIIYNNLICKYLKLLAFY
jgi:hypothetical protein